MIKNTSRKLSQALNNQACLTEDSVLPGGVQCDFAIHPNHIEKSLSSFLSGIQSVLVKAEYIVIHGDTATGKSILGKMIAKKLNYPFIECFAPQSDLTQFTENGGVVLDIMCSLNESNKFEHAIGKFIFIVQTLSQLTYSPSWIQFHRQRKKRLYIHMTRERIQCEWL